MRSDDVIVRESNIQGKGVYATRDFKKGETVLSWDITKTIPAKVAEELSPEEKKYVCKIDEKYVEMQEPEKYLNHSCNPNTEAKEFKDVAIKDIRKGEEITSDYEKVASGGPTLICKCGSKNCRGTIRT